MNTRLARWSLTVAALALPFGVLARIVLYGGLINLYVFEVAWAAWVALSLRRALRSATVHTQLWYAALLLVLAVGISATFHATAYSLPSQLIATLYALRLILYVIGLACAASLSTYHTQAEKLIQYIIALLIFGCLIQFGALPDLAILKSAGWDPHRYRIVGSFLDSSVAAALLGISLLYTACAKHMPHRRLIAASLLGLFLLTYARGAYIALFIASLWLLSSWKALRALAAIAVLCAIVLIAAPKPQGEAGKLLRTSTIESRMRDWREGYRIWHNHPILGIGYNHIRDYKSTGFLRRAQIDGYDHAGASFHNSFLMIAVTLGIVGLMVVLGMLGTLWQTAPYLRPYLAFISIYSLSDNILLLPPVLLMLSLILLAGAPKNK